MRVEQSQTQLDIQAIIRKYGGTSAETAWADELTTIERKKKTSYLDMPDSESITSSIQEETY